MNNCPVCKSSWVGDKIPENIAHNYAGTHWGREIGIDGGALGIYDGIVAYWCPDCGNCVPKGKSEWAIELFNRFIEAKIKQVTKENN